MTPPLLADKGIVIAGENARVVRSIALAAVGRGASVVVFGSDEGEASELSRQCRAASNREACHTFTATAAAWSEADIEALVSYSGRKLHELHAAVSVMPSLPARGLLELSVDDWRYAMQIQLRNPFLFCRSFMEEFLGSGSGGKFINVAPDPSDGAAQHARTATAASGILSFSRTLAKEYGRRRITTNVVLYDDEPEALDVQDLASIDAAVLFLVSDASSFVNGEVLRPMSHASSVRYSTR